MYSKNRYSMFHRPLLNAFDLNLISIGGGGRRRDASILVCSIFPWPTWMQIIIGYCCGINRVFADIGILFKSGGT